MSERQERLGEIYLQFDALILDMQKLALPPLGEGEPTTDALWPTREDLHEIAAHCFDLACQIGFLRYLDEVDAGLRPRNYPLEVVQPKLKPSINTVADLF